MGRVYNALKRAERWGDRPRPIGRPSDAREAAPRVEPFAPPAVPRGATEQSPDATFVYDERPDEASFVSASFQPPVIDDLALEQFARDQLAQGDISEERMTAAPDLPPAQMAAPRLHVAPAPPPAPAFVEPRQTASALDLSVDPHLAAIASSDDLASERYRTLAVRLINFSSRRKLKTLLLTSARQGEGKSTVAANLAWVMAKAGERRVLLIDADLRQPSIARMLGIKPRGGWLDVAEGRAKLEEAAVRINPNGLYLLAPQPGGRRHDGRPKSGAAPSRDQSSKDISASEVLTSSCVERLIKDLERHFDFILIDAPSILEFADAQRLASIADGTMMVVRAARTHHESVTDALKLIPKERRLGVVLNEAQIDDDAARGSRRRKGIRSILKKSR